MLDKDDIKAIRQASYVVLFYSPDKKQGAEWGIRVGKRNYAGGSIWDSGSHDVTRTIEANWAHCRIDSHGRSSDDVTSAVAVATIYDFEPFPACVFKQLRAGDEIGLRFIASNNNDLMKEAGLHHDEVRLRIVRNDKIVAEYPVEDCVCLNNSARIVRFADSW